MKRVIWLLVGLGAIMLGGEGVPSARTSSPLTFPLLHRASLVYEGSFRLPAAEGNKRTFDYGGTALAYDPTRNGLFAVGHDWYQLTAEVSIAHARRSPRVGRLPRARYLQPFTDATDGRISRTGGDDNKIGGQLVYHRRLYGSASIGGAAIDPARGLIYVSQQYADGAAPVIDVFRVR